MSPEMITFRHMVTKEMKAIDFILSNEERKEMATMEKVKKEWTWNLSDHCPIGFKVKIKSEVIGKEYKIGEGLREFKKREL